MERGDRQVQSSVPQESESLARFRAGAGGAATGRSPSAARRRFRDAISRDAIFGRAIFGRAIFGDAIFGGAIFGDAIFGGAIRCNAANDSNR